MPSPQGAPLIALSPYTQATLALAQSRPASSVDVPFLRAQLDTLESTLSTLLNQRDALSARLTEAVTLSSPIRLLSSELLSEIFVTAAISSHSSHDAPVLLSTLMLVCRHWRDICLCTPDLWARISISPNEPDSFEKARRRLLRSKAVPLDIILDFSPRSSYSAQAPHTIAHPHSYPLTPDHLLRTSLLLLRPTIPRWRTFVLLIPYRPQAAAALALCSSPAPLLENLTVHVTNPMLHASTMDWEGDRAAGTRRALPFGGVTPRLRECAMTSFWCERPDDLSPSSPPDLPGLGGGLSLASRDCDFPGFRPAPGVEPSLGRHGRSRMVFPGMGPGLTKLRLVGFWNDFAPNVEEMLCMLRQCPLLEELSLRNMSDMDPAEEELSVPSTAPIVLWRLRHLSFYYSGVTRTCTLLHRTALPALDRLELSFLDNITGCLKHLKQQTLSYATHYPYNHMYDQAYRSGYGYIGPQDDQEISQFPLKSLRIEASLFNELKLMRLLRRLPTLEKLELIDVEDVSSNLLKGLSIPPQPNEWILPRLETLNLEGCTSVEWDALKALVESRLPSSSASSSAAAALRHRGSISTPSQFGSLRSGAGVSSSASEYARGQAMMDTPCAPMPMSLALAHRAPAPAFLPRRIQKLDLTRCSQISRERLQWLRMYVGDVVCESGKSAWAGVDGV